jgi:hypothetical protein
MNEINQSKDGANKEDIKAIKEKFEKERSKMTLN